MYTSDIMNPRNKMHKLTKKLYFQINKFSQLTITIVRFYMNKNENIHLILLYLDKDFNWLIYFKLTFHYLLLFLIIQFKKKCIYIINFFILKIIYSFFYKGKI
jgi:hypothetical protein